MLPPPDIGRACSLKVQSLPKCHLLREAISKAATTPEHPYSPPCFISLQSTYRHPKYFALYEPTVCFSFLGSLRLWSLPLDGYSVNKPSCDLPQTLRAQLCPLTHPAPVTLASTKFLEPSKHSPACACRDSDDGGVLPEPQVRRRAGCSDQEVDSWVQIPALLPSASDSTSWASFSFFWINYLLAFGSIFRWLCCVWSLSCV